MKPHVSLLAILAVLVGLVRAPAPRATAATAAVPPLNGGLAVGVPYEDVLGTDDGYINVLHVAPDGLTGAPTQAFDRRGSIPGDPVPLDYFAAALAVGDFNRDTYPDLAVGAPGNPATNTVGGVAVLYGTFAGLTATGSIWLDQTTLDDPETAEPGDCFGAALATGDFDGDGYDDLAIGVPYEDRPSATNTGGVSVAYGGAGGLALTGAQWFSQDVAGVAAVPGDATTGDWSGSALVAGDFDGDGIDDLAIGAPGEVVYDGAAPPVPHPEAGSVFVLYGSTAGLTATGAGWFDKGPTSIDGDVTGYAAFGAALAAGDMDGDGYADLAVGVPGDDAGGVAGAGAAYVLYGTAGGLSTVMNDRFALGTGESLLGTPEEGDDFGSALAVGDIDSDGFADLLIGAPRQDVGSWAHAGRLYVLWGTEHGITTLDRVMIDETWSAGGHPPGIGLIAADNAFATAIALGDLNGDGYLDLAAGTPGYDAPYQGAPQNSAGAVYAIYNSADGFRSDNAQLWHQDVAYVDGRPEQGDRFGKTLAILPSSYQTYIPLVLRN